LGGPWANHPWANHGEATHVINDDWKS
jgi:hypothetical protein